MSEFEALKEVVHWLWKCHAEVEPDEDHETHPQLGSQQYQSITVILIFQLCPLLTSEVTKTRVA